MLCNAVLCCVVQCCAVLCCDVLCRVMLCCVVQCCAVLCCAVLCCAVLCCVVLCCILLCMCAGGISCVHETHITCEMQRDTKRNTESDPAGGYRRTDRRNEEETDAYAASVLIVRQLSSVGNDIVTACSEFGLNLIGSSAGKTPVRWPMVLVRASKHSASWQARPYVYMSAAGL